MGTGFRFKPRRITLGSAELIGDRRSFVMDVVDEARKCGPLFSTCFILNLLDLEVSVLAVAAALRGNKR